MEDHDQITVMHGGGGYDIGRALSTVNDYRSGVEYEDLLSAGQMDNTYAVLVKREGRFVILTSTTIGSGMKCGSKARRFDLTGSTNSPLSTTARRTRLSTPATDTSST